MLYRLTFGEQARFVFKKLRPDKLCLILYMRKPMALPSFQIYATDELCLILYMRKPMALPSFQIYATDELCLILYMRKPMALPSFQIYATDELCHILYMRKLMALPFLECILMKHNSSCICRFAFFVAQQEGKVNAYSKMILPFISSVRVKVYALPSRFADMSDKLISSSMNFCTV